MFGFLPIGLVYHAAYCRGLASLLMWLLVTWPGPRHLERRGGAARTSDRGRDPRRSSSSSTWRSSSTSASSPSARPRGKEEVEDYFLARRSLGPFVFLMSLFGTNMTAFAILGSSGHAFHNGIVTFGLMASSSALVIPLSLFLIGTRVWALGKRYGFITPVQLFRDRWETSHIGTVIFALQAALLLPYVIIGVMGGGTTLSAVSGGRVPFWLGGAVVALVVMSYVFFGGMRGTAWVNTFQTMLFLASAPWPWS